MKWGRATITFVCAAIVALPLAGGTLPKSKPEDVGVSTERLQRVHEVIQHHIDAGDTSGAVTLIARRGHIAYFEAQGIMDLETKKPMTKDTIFRLASMSKPITAVAILILFEEGKIRLEDPVSKFIPEFKDMKVALQRGTGHPQGLIQPGLETEFDLVPADRDITIRDLLTHTSGFASSAYSARQVMKIAPRESSDTLASYIPKLASVPLDFQPGSQWRYSAVSGFEVLSRVVEVASGQAYDQFLKQRVFDPLGMKDTSFVQNKARLATLYVKGPRGLEPDVESPYLSSTYFSGAAGLMSTAEDYLQLSEMLLNGGQSLNGKRLLSPKTVELMSSNQVGDMFNGQRAQFGFSLLGMGFGLSTAVMTDDIAARMRVSNGAFGWNGGYGTVFWVDPKEQMVELLMIQGRNPEVFVIKSDFESAVMQSLVD
jgi:CubicO group peptidase (beta-lactamase class C family)